MNIKYLFIVLWLGLNSLIVKADFDSCGREWELCKPNYVNFKEVCISNSGKYINESKRCVFDSRIVSVDIRHEAKRMLAKTCFEAIAHVDNIENFIFEISYKGVFGNEEIWVSCGND